MQVGATVLENPQITREALRVLGVLMRHLDWSNRSKITVSAIAAHLGIDPANASRGLGVLRTHQIVFQIRQGEYEINAEVLFVGSLDRARKKKKWRAAQDARQQATP